MFKKSILVFLVAIAAGLLMTGCKGNKGNSNKVYKDQVVIHGLSDAKGLNPITTSDAYANQYIVPNIFQTLLAYDHQTMEILPVLAKSRPVVRMNGDIAELDFELRPEATWDNGAPVTTDDVLFSFKTAFCPNVNNDNIKPGVDFIKDIRTSPDNNRKFTVICNKYIGMEDGVGTTIYIMPEAVYDPQHILRKYPFAAYLSEHSPAANDAAIKTFATNFNSEKVARDSSLVKGSGAYRLLSFETGQRLIVERKANWWGDKIKKENEYFEAYPKRLVFETINDFNTALTALVDEKLDFIYVTPVKEYIELDNSPKFKDNFIKSEPQMMSYQAIGVNNKDKILSDVKVRQALCYLTNVDQIIQKVLYGKAIRTIGSILPMKKDEYNNNITPYPYDVEKAKALLAEAGWKDSDGDGVLDKIIDGQKTKFEIAYNYNAGNPLRETVGLLIQRTYKQAGIIVNIKPLDWSLYLDELKKHHCQLFYQGWVKQPSPDDEKQVFHTSSANGGSNYMSFGNAKTDALIDQIRTEMDVKKRDELYKEWQQITHDEVPYIFLYVQNFKNCVHNRFENIKAGPVYPGVWFAAFKVKEGYKVEGQEATKK
ncbi:MAG TPA: ABC transporter substrate-binding protein [Chitinophagales bacterium]|nr:ABC transporter substrate-binding protein [Chitinophagales bacterium]HNM32004.1 ABC transporter substrate-binding protein [Chitinophagales bacterium]